MYCFRLIINFNELKLYDIILDMEDSYSISKAKSDNYKIISQSSISLKWAARPIAGQLCAKIMLMYDTMLLKFSSSEHKFVEQP